MSQTPQTRVLFKHTLSKLLMGVFAAFMVLAVSASVTTLFPRQANAAASKTLNFQARLLNANGAIVPDGTYNVEFKLYKSQSTGGSAQGTCVGGVTDDCVWRETRLVGDAANLRVNVRAGYLSVYLGDKTDLPSNIWNQQLWLSMNIGGTGGTATWDGEMSPRLRLTAVPAAYSLTQYNGTTGFSSSLSIAGATGGDQNFVIPDQGAAGTFNLLTSLSGIQNQIAVQQSPASAFWIGGTGRADTSFLTPTLDTPSGTTTLSIGTTNATAGINLNQNTSIATGKTLTVVAGATALTGAAAGNGTALTVTAGATTNVGLVIQMTASQTADSFQVKDSSNNVNLAVNAAGNRLTLGTLNTVGGQLVINSGTTNFAATVETSGLTADRRFLLPNTGLATTGSPGTICVYNGTNSNCPAATGSTAYISNSTTVMEDANFYIRSFDPASPVGVLEGANGQTADLLQLNTYNGTTSTTVARVTNTGNLMVAASIDVNTATQLSLGATNANAISISKTGVTTTVNGALTVAEATSLNGNTTIGNATTDRLTVTSQVLGQDALVFQGATDDTFTTTFRFTDPTANNIITFPNASGTVQLAPTAGSYLLQVPTSNTAGNAGANVISPTTAGIVGLTVNATTGTTAAAAIFNQSNNTTPADTIQVNSTNTSSTQTNGIQFNRNGAGGTTTNGVMVQQTAGTLTNGFATSGTIGTGINLGGTLATGIDFTGTVSGNLINATNFKVSTAGVVTLAGGQAADVTTSSAATSGAITVQPGNSTLAGGTGSNVTISGSNQTGTGTTVGGSVFIQGGTGTTRGDVVLQSAGGSVGIGTTPNASYKLDVAGNVNVSTGSAYLINGASINTGGTLNNVAYLDQNNQFTGYNSFTRNGGIGAGDYTVGLTGAPGAGATSSLLRLGNAIAGGNAVANGGTYIGINTPAAGAGSAADFLHFQSNGNVRMQVTNTGTLNLRGSSASTNLIVTRVDGDTNDRLVVKADGGINWGTGAAATDTNLYRSGIGTLQTDGSLIVNQANTTGTNINGVLVNRNGVGGTTTNGLHVSNTAGTLTNAITTSGTIVTGINLGGTLTTGIDFTGTVSGNLINAANFSVSTAGVVTVQGGQTQDIKSAGATNLTIDTGGAAVLNLGTTNANAINIGPAASTAVTTINGKLRLRPATASDATDVLRVQNSAGANIFNIDTTSSNLITNSSFEANMTGWSAHGGGAAPSQTVSAHYDGNAGAQVNATAANHGIRFNYNLAASTTYTFSVFARASGSNFATFEIGRSNDTGAADVNTSCPVAQTLETGRWQRFSCTFTTGASVSGTRYIYAKQTDGTTRTWYIDAAQLEVAASSTAYRNSKVAVSNSMVINGGQLDAAASNSALQINSLHGGQGLTIFGAGEVGPNALFHNAFEVKMLSAVAGSDVLLSVNDGSRSTEVRGGNGFLNLPALSVTTVDTTANAIKVTGIASATAPVSVIQAGATPGVGANLLQLQDTSGNVNAAFNNVGNQLTLGRISGSGTVTQGQIVLSDGTTSNFGATIRTEGTLSGNSTFRLNVGTANGTYDICTTLSVCTGYATTPTTGNFLQQVPTSNTAGTAGANVVAPTAASIVGLTVNATTGTSAAAAIFNQANNTTPADTLQVNTTNTAGTQTNGIQFNRNGAGGTTTNGFLAQQTAGTLTNGFATSGTIDAGINLGGTLTTGIDFTGTVSGNLINATNFKVSTAGVVTLQGNQTSDITTTAGGTANPITVRPGNATNASGTGAALNLFGGNQTGTTSTGGAVNIQGGTGTTTNGAVNIGATNTSAINLGSTSANITTTINGVALVKTTAGNSSANAFRVQDAGSVSVFNVDTANYSVGVGTNSPTATFQVDQPSTGTGTVSNGAGSATVTGTNTRFTNAFKAGDTFTVTSTGNTCTVSAIANDTSLTCTGPLAGASTNSAYTITSAGTRLVVLGNGNVGIGNTAPGQTLVVQGNGAQLYATGATNQSVYQGTNWLRSAKNTVTVFVGDNDDTSTYVAADSSGAIRFNGTNVAWGDIAYHPQGGGSGNNGQFIFSTTGSTINATPNAKVGVGDLYVNGSLGIGKNNPTVPLDVVGSTVLTTTGTAATLQVNSTNTTGTQTNGIQFNRNGVGGTTTNGISVTNTAGTLTNAITTSGTIVTGINLGGTLTTGIDFTGTISGNLLNATNFKVSTAGVVTLQGNQTSDITTAGGTTVNPITVKPGIATVASGTGAALNLQGGNQTGTTSTGGAVNIQGGTGTTTNGAINVGIANTSAVNLGATGITTTANGTLRVGASAGAGAFVNNGTTLNTVTTQSTGANVSISNINSYSAFVLTATAGSISYTLPDPSPTTAGKVVYISNASTGSNAFTLAPTNGTSILLNTGATATLMWNGTRWTYAGTDTSNLQNAYTNSVGGTTPEIVLDSTRNGVDIQDTNGGLGSTTALFAVRAGSVGGTNGNPLFTVTNSGGNTGTPLVGIGVENASRTLHVRTNNTSINTPPLLVEQTNTGGDSGLEIKNSNQSFYLGVDTSDGSKFKISSSTGNGSQSILGYDVIGTSTDSSDSNIVNAIKWVATTSGNINTSYAFVASPIGANPNNRARMAIYSDGPGYPATALGTSNETVLAGDVWNSFTFGSPVAVTAGTTYWIAYNTNGTAPNQNNLRFTNGVIPVGDSQYYNSNYTPTPFPANGAPGIAGNPSQRFSMYASVGNSVADNFSASLFQLSAMGAATFQNSSNSSLAFQVLNVAGTQVLQADTTNSRVGINLAGSETPSYDLSFGGGADKTIGVNQRTTSGAGRGLTIQAGQGSAGAGGVLTLQGGAGQGTNQAGGAVNITGGAPTGSGTAGAVNVGTTGTSAVNIGATGITTTNNGNFRIGATAGSGSLVNNGSTLNAMLAVTDRNGANTWLSGSSSNAATTVDIYTGFTVNQTTASQTLQVPNPTSATAGRVIYISNIGSEPITLLSTQLRNGATATLVWSGSAWSFAGADGNSILNQNSTDQVANFRITGTGQITGPAAGSATALTINTSVSSNKGLRINTVGSATNAFEIYSGVVSQVTAAFSNAGDLILGGGAATGAVQSPDVSTAATNSLALLMRTGNSTSSGNTGTLTLQSGNATSGTAGNIVIDNGTSSTGSPQINIGTSTSNHDVHIADNTTGTQNVTIGSMTGTSSTIIRGGSGGANGNLILETNNAASGVRVRSNTNSTIGFMVVNATNSPAFTVDTTNKSINFGSGSSGSTAMYMYTVAGADTGFFMQSGTTGTLSSSNVQYILSKRANNTDFYFQAYDGTTYWNYLQNTYANKTVTVNDFAAGITIIGASGASTNATTVRIADSANAVQTVYIGSTNTSSTTTIQAGTGNINFNAATAQFTESASARTLTVQTRSAAGVGTGLTVSAGNANGANVGGTLTLQGGTAGATNVNGGDVVITGGGAVGGTGVQGLVKLAPTAFTATSTQAFGSSGSLAAGLVDTYSTIPVSASAAGVTITIPAPAITATVGRVLYVANVGVNDLTISLAGSSVSIVLKPNSTATLIWNGTGWTAAGASSSTDLQAAYNNTATSAGGAELVLNAPGGSADGLTIRNNGTTPIVGGLLEVQSSIGTNLFSVNDYATEYAKNGGAETQGASSSTFPATTWAAAPGGGTVARHTTAANVSTGLASVSVTTTATANHGAKNTLSQALISTRVYQVSFTAKLAAGTLTNNLLVSYSDNGTTVSSAACTAPPLTNWSLSTATWTKVTCTFTAAGTITANNAIVIRQSDATARTFYIDNLSVTEISSSTTPSNVQIGGGITGGQPTLFTLDRFSSAPVATGNSTYYGSMYFDTTTGNIQCYEADGWGACGSAPNNIITLTPEYTGAVLNGTGVGTMTADFCGNGGGLSVNISFCASNEARNYYRWTSPQPTDQTYSIYVTYKLPSTFKEFEDNNTIKLTTRVTDTTLAGVNLEVFRKSGSSLTSCGAHNGLDSANNTWQQVNYSANENSCGFAGGDYVVFKISVIARSNASAYIENLDFTYTNK